MSPFLPPVSTKGHDPKRIVWAAYYSHDWSTGERWQIMLRDGTVRDLMVTHTDDRPKAIPYHCWPWTHEYVARRDWGEKLDDGSPFGPGSYKPYQCRRCGKGKMTWRRDIF